MTLIDTSQYLTLSILGRGNHPVLKVQSLDSQQHFALKKIIRDDFDHHLSDLQELMVLSSLSHQNIVKIQGFETKHMLNKVLKKEVYVLYILLELLECNLCQEVYDRKGHLKYYTKFEMRRIVNDFLEAVSYLHEKGFAHRDLKPENALRGSDGRVVLTDFNDSFKSNEIRPTAKTIVGSPYYMAPELRKAFVDGEELCEEKYDVFKADVWALGMTILDLATLSIGESKNLKEKLETVKRRYGEKFRDFINGMLENDFRNRKSIKEIKDFFMKEGVLVEKEIEEKIEFDSEKLKECNVAKELYEVLKNKTMNLVEKRNAFGVLERVCEMEEENKRLKSKMVEFERDRRDLKQDKEKAKPKDRKERSLLKTLTGIFCSPA